MNKNSVIKEKSDLINSILSEWKMDNVKKNTLSKLKKSTRLNIFRKYINFSESYNGKIIEFEQFGGKISYSYQRHNLEFKTDNWLEFIYNYHDKLKCSNSGTFFSCCIASITTLFSILVNKNYKDFVFTDLPYFESFDFLDFYFKNKVNVDEIKNCANRTADVLFIDSGSPSFLDVDYSNFKTKIIILDTSCLGPTNEYIKNLIAYCDKKNITLFLSRSHMKLDCFGLEIGRLGSLICLNDDQDFIQEIIKLKILLGNNAILHNIYPWLGNKNFFELTEKQIERAQKITLIMQDTLRNIIDKNKYEIIEFDHKLFFTIRFKNRYKENFDVLNSNISKYCQDNNLPVNTASSFYLEKVGIDNFERRLDNDGQHLRVSSSLILENKARKIAEKINEYLSKFIL